MRKLNKVEKERSLWLGRYKNHKYIAERRDIPFLLTFKEWFKIWESSGHKNKRGCRKGQYVMARFGDTGPYAVGNVRICTTEENHAERWNRPGEREAAKELGRQLARSNIGREFSEEHREAISKAGKGKTRTLLTKQRISKALIGVVRDSEKYAKAATTARSLICFDDGNEFASIRRASEFYGWGLTRNQRTYAKGVIKCGKRFRGKLLQFKD